METNVRGGSGDPGGTVHAVTGGASGIGAATAALLASQGHAVVVLDRQAPASSSDSPATTFIATDVADPASVAAAFAEIDRRFGRLDGLVNSAGVESRRLLRVMGDADWDRVQAINVRGTMSCLREAAALMRRERRGGAIVNVASVAGKRISYSGDAAYTASKGAVLALTRHAAFELAVDGIRVNAVCPGPTLTPMIRRSLTPEQIEAVARQIPLGRWVTAEDVAQTIAFLLGPASSSCTGTSIDVDGGILVSNGSPYEAYFASRLSG